MEYTGERLIIDNKECEVDSDIYQEHVARYKYAIKFIKNKDKILDIACGSGYGSNLLAQHSQEVWAGDVDKEVIELAKKKYELFFSRKQDKTRDPSPRSNGTQDKLSRLNFKKMDAVNLPFADNYFDTVVSFETIEHIENYMKFVSELKRVLKPGGKLILSTPNVVATKKLAINNPFHLKEFTREELLDIFKDFGDLKIYGQRSLKKIKCFNKLLSKIYYIYSKFKWLSFMSKVVSADFKKKTGDKITALGDDFGIKEMEEGREYLYYVVVGRKELGNYKF